MDGDDHFDDDDLFDEEDEWEDCGLGSDGQCSMAGTEHCDFSCSNRNTAEFTGSAEWYRARGETPPWEKKT